MVLFYRLQRSARKCFAYRALTEARLQTQSPLTDCQIASAASAAVSARRMRGPKRHRRDEGQGAQHLAFGRIEAAFRSGENGGRAALAARGLAPAASASPPSSQKKSRRSFGQAASSFLQRHGLADLRHRQPARLFRRLDGIGRHALLIDAGRRWCGG